ncbi:MAG: glycosyltransferase family 39 protein [Candidatus Peribacteraceae bacterium]|nr:glycosyltransferase family 39 protein [Candidatus Peribacteraceae bacterium]MBP9850120.1 glycosyltransferase family 39 protein [Candidatus Peribacteraceae bacterium]
MKRIHVVLGRITSTRSVWVGPVLFALVYLAIQLTQISAYGVTWDEPLHRNWGKIFALFWKTGDRSLLDLMPGHGIDYSPIYFYLNFLVSEFLYSRGSLGFVEANHVLTVVVSAVAVGFTYQLGQMVGGKRVGLCAACFLVLFPPFIAHAHYNPKDIPLLVAVLLTAVVFVIAIRRNSGKFFVMSGFLFGLSVALKINALLMGPVFGFTYVAWLVSRTRSSSFVAVLRKEVPIIAVTVIACVLSIYLFWPSAWGDWSLIPSAIAFFLGPNFWPGKVLFFGTEYTGVDLPFYYIPFEVAVAMPLLMLIASVVGVFVMARTLSRSEKWKEYLFLLLWIGFPIFFSMKPGIVRYDSMRQFFFIMPAVAVAAAIGLTQLLDLLKRRSKNPIAGPVFLVLVIFSLGSQLLTIHPFEGSYRNEIMQIAFEKNLDESFQIEYWGSVYNQGMDWLAANAEAEPVICVPTAGILVTWYPWRDDFTFECSGRTNYVMFFTRYTEARAYRDLKDPVFSIERMKSPLLLIYKTK